MPKRGTLVRDTSRDRIGEVMAVGHHGRYYLRPLRGGCEWEVRPEFVEVLTPREALRAKLHEVNARSARRETRRW